MTTHEGSTAVETERVETRGGALGETFEDVEKSVLEAIPTVTGIEEGEAAVPMAGVGINIAGVRTVSQAGNQSVFLVNSDALALVIDIIAPQALVSSGHKFDADFEIIDYTTNTVKRNQWWNNISFSWGTNFWISQGNNWGPTPNDYTTPQKWGLSPGIYIFRATVSVQGVSAFGYSNDALFRVR